tara:strand:- start:2795 stop:4075 length:1281 start_codon:yes stop_codon:yes gene_type:complete
MTHRQNIAVIGAGISGIAASYYLYKYNNVSIFESAPRLGGHANTISVKDKNGATQHIDTGFIVYNKKNYPNFLRFLAELQVESLPTDMSFSYTNPKYNISYAGTRKSIINTIVQPSYKTNRKILLSIYKYTNKLKQDKNKSSLQNITIRDYLSKVGCPTDTIENYFVPIASAIWSCNREDANAIPANAYITFFENHGLLDLFKRLHWYTICGGSKTYIDAFVSKFLGKISLNTKITQVIEQENGVLLHSHDGKKYNFDQVILATHADISLKIASNLTNEKKSILGSHKYSYNDVYLHTDKEFMPKDQTSWACWNAITTQQNNLNNKTYITYYSNRLQNLKSYTKYFITVNPPIEPKPETTLYKTKYSHPILTKTWSETMSDLSILNSNSRISFCGAYLGYGFHEDGFRSGKLIANKINSNSTIYEQ